MTIEPSVAGALRPAVAAGPCPLGRRMGELGREGQLEMALEKLDLSRTDYRPASAAAFDGPTTTPYELRDLLDLLEADEGGERPVPPDQGKPGSAAGVRSPP